MKWMYFLALVSMVTIACNNKPSSEKEADMESVSKAPENELSAVDTAAECENEGNFENPNGNSELALLMKKMDEQIRESKQALKKGNMPELNFDHTPIKTAESTKEGIMDATYMAYANAYLNSLEEYKKAEKNSVADAHNLLITNCISCHKSYCTGPIVRIKKLRVKSTSNTPM